MTDLHVQEFRTGRNNLADPFTYVGQLDRLFYNPINKTIRVSDAVTPGGLPIAGGGSSAEAIYSTVAPPATPDGLMWFNPDTDTLSVASGGVWVTVGGGGSSAVSLYTNTTPAATPDGLLWFKPSTNTLSVASGSTWIPVSGATSLDQLSDVTITSPQSGQALLYNSGQFRNVSLNLSGGANNQILVKKSGTDYDYQWEDMIINIPDNAYTKLLDQVSSNLLYLGEAAPDSLENQAVWRIQRIIFDATGNVDEVRYAEGGLFNQIWNNRAGLIYV